jgi:hypothetical protein
MHFEHIALNIRRLPEGVWLATSDDLPGLTVECDNRDETEAAARAVALDLIEEKLGHPPARQPRFTVVLA